MARANKTVKPKVSVIVATYNRESDLVRAIKSVLQQDYPNFELMVVDQTKQHQAATDEYLQSITDKRFLYYRVTPNSLPGARNFGIARAKGEIIIFIDDDVTLEPGFVAAHAAEYTSDDIGAAAGRVVGLSEKPAKELFHMNWRGKKYGSYNFLECKEAWSARGCNMSFRKKVLSQLGGFDTGYRGNALCEDVDMSLRVRKAGYKIMFTPHAEQMHYDAPEGGCREEGPTFNHLMAWRNQYRFFFKHFSKWALLPHMWMLFWRYGPADRNVWRACKRVSYLVVAPFMAYYDLNRLPPLELKEVRK